VVGLRLQPGDLEDETGPEEDLVSTQRGFHVVRGTQGEDQRKPGWVGWGELRVSAMAIAETRPGAGAG